LSEENYRGGHRPPGPDSGYGAPFHDLTEMWGADVYDHPEWYAPDMQCGVGTDYGQQELRGYLRAARGNPDYRVPIYRALPPKNTTIYNGDWVTPSLRYARAHNEGMGGGLSIIHSNVPASSLLNGGEGMFEWGYNGPDHDGVVV
jgi:hypothetical protein